MAVIKRIANKNAQDCVRLLVPFQGSNLFGEYIHDKKEAERFGWHNPYVVYSYGYHFPMFIFINGHWYENSDKYSVSTSKQQSQAHPTMETVKLNTEDMKRLLRKNTQERINQ
jgi:hypothetical protein